MQDFTHADHSPDAQASTLPTSGHSNHAIELCMGDQSDCSATAMPAPLDNVISSQTNAGSKALLARANGKTGCLSYHLNCLHSHVLCVSTCKMPVEPLVYAAPPHQTVVPCEICTTSSTPPYNDSPWGHRGHETKHLVSMQNCPLLGVCLPNCTF